MSLEGLPKQPIYSIGAPAREFEAMKEADVQAMVEACAEVLRADGETPDEIVEEMLPSLKNVLRAWWSAAISRG